MESTDVLKHEHRVIELVLDGLEKLADEIDQGEKLNKDKAQKALEILRNFADKCHHGKEEQRLFKLMEQRGMSSSVGPLAVMYQEHEKGRGHIRAMLDSLDRAAEGDSESGRIFSENAREYVAMLRQHIQKEDNILYPMAEKILQPDDDKNLTESFDEFERAEIGEGVHEKYHQWAHELGEK